MPVTNLGEKEKQYLLETACEAILSSYEKREAKARGDFVPPDLVEQRRGVMVSIYRNKRLCGQAGHILAKKNLYEDVINCTRQAITGASFPELSSDQAKELDVEISIFSQPKKFDYDLPLTLSEYLEKYRPGVILRKRSKQAVLMPNAWKKFRFAEKFLGELCQKAGLPPYEWTRGVIIETFREEKIT